MISPFVTQGTKSNFVFVGPSKSAETLLRDIRNDVYALPEYTTHLWLHLHLQLRFPPLRFSVLLTLMRNSLNLDAVQLLTFSLIPNPTNAPSSTGPNPQPQAHNFLFTPHCKCLALHILVRFKLYRTAHSLATDLTATLPDPTDTSLFLHLHDTFHL
ncbi:hypothetical protein JHK87_030999 [Glycine soja]|nr:hypothetical protein JHK87_030999 [Glycine soja]